MLREATLLFFFSTLVACRSNPVLEPREISDSAAHPDVRKNLSHESQAQRGKNLQIAVISDLNSRYGEREHPETVPAAIRWLVAKRPDLVLCTGDMVAGQQSGHDYRDMWRAFHELVTIPLTRAGIPFAVTPGNHDGSVYQRYIEERHIFIDEWRSHRPPLKLLEGSSYPLRYAFKLGPALFVALDATSVGPLPPEHHDWLETMLRTNAEFSVRVVFGHVPLYPLTQGRETEILGDPHLESLLIRHGIDAYISGHHHGYYPARRGPLRLISVPSLAGNRPLLGQEERQPASLLWLELGEGGITQVEALIAPEFTKTIPRETLPESLGEAKSLLHRDDLSRSANTNPIPPNDSPGTK